MIVVGSGAGGGQTAYTLTMEGAKVLMLEAGRNYDPVKETPMFQTTAQAPLRGASTPDKPFCAVSNSTSTPSMHWATWAAGLSATL